MRASSRDWRKRCRYHPTVQLLRGQAVWGGGQVPPPANGGHPWVDFGRPFAPRGTESLLNHSPAASEGREGCEAAGAAGALPATQLPATEKAPTRPTCGLQVLRQPQITVAAALPQAFAQHINGSPPVFSSVRQSVWASHCPAHESGGGRRSSWQPGGGPQVVQHRSTGDRESRKERERAEIEVWWGGGEGMKYGGQDTAATSWVAADIDTADKLEALPRYINH